VLTDLVRSYTTQAQSVVPDFLAESFEMLKQGQSKMVENMTAMNPMAKPCLASTRCARSRRPSSRR
jgi:polyhydroxyalkanoate synthesis regulator protein